VLLASDVQCLTEWVAIWLSDWDNVRWVEVRQRGASQAGAAGLWPPLCSCCIRPEGCARSSRSGQTAGGSLGPQERHPAWWWVRSGEESLLGQYLSRKDNWSYISHWTQTPYQHLVLVYIRLSFQLTWFKCEINKTFNHAIEFRLKVTLLWLLFENPISFSRWFNVITYIFLLKWPGNNVNSTSMCPVGSYCMLIQPVRAQWVPTVCLFNQYVPSGFLLYVYSTSMCPEGSCCMLIQPVCAQWVPTVC
jgi:hypothetical protein